MNRELRGGVLIKKMVFLRHVPFYYGWVVLGLCFLALFASFGIRVSFGSYITSWEQEFGINRTVVSTISLLSFFVLAIAQPLVGKLNDRFGARSVLTLSLCTAGVALILCSVANQLWQLVLLYGVFVSLGVTGAANVTATALITRWFTAKRGLALGITMSGMAVGQLVVVPLSLYLVSHFDWRYSIGILGVGVLFVFMPLMFFFVRSKPTDLGLKSYGEVTIVAEQEERNAQVQLKEKQEPVWTVLKQRVFWQLAIPYFVCGFTDVGLVDTHYIPFAEGKGFSVGVIAFTFSLIAIANIFGTIGTGYLADRWNRSRLLAMIYGIRGLTFVLLLVANKPWLLAVFAVFYGITEMASIAPTSSLCVHLFNKYSIGVIFGFVSVSHQLGGAIGSFVPGVIYDLTNSYVMVFLLSIILIAVSALIVSRVPDLQGQKA